MKIYESPDNPSAFVSPEFLIRYMDVTKYKRDITTVVVESERAEATLKYLEPLEVKSFGDLKKTNYPLVRSDGTVLTEPEIRW